MPSPAVIPEAVVEFASEVLNDYFNLSLPNDFIKKVLLSDEELFREAMSFGTRDTFVRDLFIDVVMKHIGHTHWPMYGDSEEYSENFYIKLKELTESVGGSIISK